jgi:hypothetical protein
MLVAETRDFLKYQHHHLFISSPVDGASSLLSQPHVLYFHLWAARSQPIYSSCNEKEEVSFWCVGVGYGVHTRHVFETLNKSGILLSV